MNTNRTTAIIVGVLYIIGTVAGILSVVFTSSILGDPEYLIKVSANASQIALGALFVLVSYFIVGKLCYTHFHKKYYEKR